MAIQKPEGCCIITSGSALGDYTISQVVSNSCGAEAWAITSLDYGACSAARLWSAIVHALHPVARIPISCVRVVLWVVSNRATLKSDQSDSCSLYTFLSQQAHYMCYSVSNACATQCQCCGSVDLLFAMYGIVYATKTV